MRRIFVLIILTSLLGCHSQCPPAPAPDPTVALALIYQISPNNNQPLRVGQQVDLTVSATYALSSDSGTLALYVEDANYKAFIKDYMKIGKGSGNGTFGHKFTVPNTSEVHVYVAAYPSGRESTNTVARRDFRVVGR